MAGYLIRMQMKFELAIDMDGRGFTPPTRMSLVRVLEEVARDVQDGGNNGTIRDWYGDPVGTWAIIGKRAVAAQ